MKKFVTPLIISAAVIALLLAVRWYTGQQGQHAGHDHAEQHHDSDKTSAQEAAATSDETSAQESATGGKIVVSVPNWPSAKARAHVLKVVIENNFGVEVELQNGTNPVIFEGMDSGAMHVHPEGWLPNHANLHKKYVEERQTVRQGKVPADADQAICTTKDTLQNTGIVKLEELAKPEMAAKFDTDGDGKGEMWIGATGWAATNVEKIRAKSYGYDQTMQLKEMDETLALAEIDATIAKKGNVVFYCYSPHHIFLLYGLEKLQEEPHDPAQWEVLQPTDDPDWLQKSRAITAWEKAAIFVYYAASLEKTHPAVAKMLAKVNLDNAATNELTHAIVVEKIPADQFAQHWVKENSAMVDTWLR